MMHVNRYCNATREDITTPGDVVEALNSFGGVSNCTAEILHIRRDYDNLLKWIEAHKTGKIAKMGRINEFVYSKMGEDLFSVKCFPLSGGVFNEYQIGQFKSSAMNMEPGALPPHKSTGEGGETNDSIDQNAMEENVQDGEAETRLETFADSAEIAYQSNITGVTVWARSRLRKNQRRRRTRYRYVIQEVEDEIREAASIADQSGDAQGRSVDGEYIMFECEKCEKLYRREDFFKRHIEICIGKHGSQKVIDRACRMALEILGTPDAPVHTTKDVHPSVSSLEIDESLHTSLKQSKGWARRPAYGKTLGSNSVHRYAEDITEWFELGQKDKGKKLSPSRMREKLIQKYPRRYDIPGEHYILSFVSCLVRKHKKNVQQMVNGEPLEGRNAGRRGVQEPYCSIMANLVQSRPELMPRHSPAALIEAMGLNPDILPNDFPQESSIKNKCSSLRASRRNAHNP